MSPKSMHYSANSIIYFKGDLNDKIFILQEGKVRLDSIDIENGQEVHDLIQMGEFFGVKSALSKLPRVETAVVLSDSTIIMFTVPEFEQLVLKNTRIIIKMLRVFSNQLRRIHKQVRNLLYTDEKTMAPETGLFNIGNYYINNKKYRQAIYAFKRYLTYYPSGSHALDASQKIELAELKMQQHGGADPAVSRKQQGNELSDSAREFYNAVSLFSQQKYVSSLEGFKKIITNYEDEEYIAKSIYEIGRCYYSLGEYDQCIRHYTSMIQRYPKHPELADALFYVGNCYEQKGDMVKAKNFYSKIVTMASSDSSAYRKAKKALRKIEEV